MKGLLGRTGIVPAAILSGAVVLSGCGSKDSGDQVQVTEEAKAQIQSRRDAYSKQPKKTAPSAGKSSKSKR